jgi:hypothetical protein
MMYNIKNDIGDIIHMIRTFKEVSSFTKKWKDLGLTEDDLVVLEELLLKDTKLEM